MIIRDIVSILHKTYVVTPNLNRLDETVQMRGHNISFLMRNKKHYPQIIIKYSSYLELCFLYACRRRVVLCRAFCPSVRQSASVLPSVRPLAFRVRSIAMIPFKIFS